jgi:hypothetical protein
MLNLGEVGIRIAVVDQGVEIVGHFPDALFAAVQGAILSLLFDDKIECLVSVILAVELGYGGIGVGLIVAELVLGLALAIADGDKVVPIVELLQRGIIG